MSKSKKTHPAIKSQLHPRNRHRRRYDFNRLAKACPDLANFIKPNKYDDLSIDFFDPAAVKILNRALLQAHYQIDYWDIPEHFLCPPIPGRADYIHYLADLLAGSNAGDIPKGKEVKGLDIGIGANGIYSILGQREYGWSFVGSETDELAIASVHTIIAENPTLNGYVEVRKQKNSNSTFNGIIGKNEVFDFSLCNPPFYSSQQAVEKEHLRKMRNLTKQKSVKASPNFGGKSNELWCTGGEKQFIGNMIRQSKQMKSSCFWYTTLVSRAEHVDTFYVMLKKEEAVDVKTIAMSQGHKSSQILAWTFLTPKEQTAWATDRWKPS
ncbi:MAG: 23S rRNA (adenine(1618)-N(6))-methyltransferase RlmF [Gammaproteobacteria bacterium]